MMKKSIIYFILILIIGCNNGNSHSTKQSEDNSLVGCENTQLYQFLLYNSVNNYRIVNKDGTPVEIVFYYAYFFKSDTNYVTIWRSYEDNDLNYLVSENPCKTFESRCLKIEDYNYIIITDQFFDNHDLFQQCSDCFINIENLPKPDNIINDGPLFARSYKYYFDDENYIFERLEEYKIDFLGEEWVEWEKYAVEIYNRIRSNQ